MPVSTVDKEPTRIYAMHVPVAPTGGTGTTHVCMQEPTTTSRLLASTVQYVCKFTDGSLSESDDLGANSITCTVPDSFMTRFTLAHGVTVIM